MRYILVSILFLIISLKMLGQDTIHTYSKETIICKIVEILDDKVKYKFLAEDIVNSISKNNFTSIVLESGRIINGNPRVVIKNENDWMNVIITKETSDVTDLVKVAEISEKAVSSVGAYGSLEKMKKKAQDGLKKKAAKIGCHIVLISEDNSRDGKTNQSFKWTTASFTGMAYKYKDN